MAKDGRDLSQGQVDGHQERSKRLEGEKDRDEGRTERQNWTKMGLTADQKVWIKGYKHRGGRRDSKRERNGV